MAEREGCQCLSAQEKPMRWLTYSSAQELEASPVAGGSRAMLRAVHSRKSLLLEEILGSSRHSCRKVT